MPLKEAFLLRGKIPRKVRIHLLPEMSALIFHVFLRFVQINSPLNNETPKSHIRFHEFVQFLPRAI